MRPRLNYLAAYPVHLVQEVYALIDAGRLAEKLLQKYPSPHDVRTDSALYRYAMQIKQAHLRNAGPLNRLTYDGSLQTMSRALGMNSGISRVQGARLKSSSEIRIATLFKDTPQEFLRMIVVHELAHLKEREHGKAFYRLCNHMEPDYHRLEFDLRAYLTYLDAGGEARWSGSSFSV